MISDDTNCNATSKTDSTGTFKYDPFGRRIYKSSISGTSIYAFDGDDLIEETNSSGAAVARYSQGLNIDEPLAMLRSATTSYYQGDGLGPMTSSEQHLRSPCQHVHLRFLRQHHCHNRLPDELLPVHRARIRQRNQPLLLPRQILRSAIQQSRQ